MLLRETTVFRWSSSALTQFHRLMETRQGIVLAVCFQRRQWSRHLIWDTARSGKYQLSVSCQFSRGLAVVTTTFHPYLERIEVGRPKIERNSTSPLRLHRHFLVIMSILGINSNWTWGPSLTSSSAVSPNTHTHIFTCIHTNNTCWETGMETQGIETRDSETRESETRDNKSRDNKTQDGELSDDFNYKNVSLVLQSVKL